MANIAFVEQLLNAADDADELNALATRRLQWEPREAVRSALESCLLTLTAYGDQPHAANIRDLLTELR